MIALKKYQKYLHEFQNITDTSFENLFIENFFRHAKQTTKSENQMQIQPLNDIWCIDFHVLIIDWSCNIGKLHQNARKICKVIFLF